MKTIFQLALAFLYLFIFFLKGAIYQFPPHWHEPESTAPDDQHAPLRNKRPDFPPLVQAQGLETHPDTERSKTKKYPKWSLGENDGARLPHLNFHKTSPSAECCWR